MFVYIFWSIVGLHPEANSGLLISKINKLSILVNI